MHLAPLLKAENLNLLEEAERRLTNPGAVSTAPAPSKDRGKKQQGARKTKRDIYNKYFHK